MPGTPHEKVRVLGGQVGRESKNGEGAVNLGPQGAGPDSFVGGPSALASLPAGIGTFHDDVKSGP